MDYAIFGSSLPGWDDVRFAGNREDRYWLLVSLGAAAQLTGLGYGVVLHSNRHGEKKIILRHAKKPVDDLIQHRDNGWRAVISAEQERQGHGSNDKTQSFTHPRRPPELVFEVRVL